MATTKATGKPIWVLDKVDAHQKFLDDAAMKILAAFSTKTASQPGQMVKRAYDLAEELWAERQRRIAEESIQ